MKYNKINSLFLRNILLSIRLSNTSWGVKRNSPLRRDVKSHPRLTVVFTVCNSNAYIRCMEYKFCTRTFSIEYSRASSRRQPSKQKHFRIRSEIEIPWRGDTISELGFGEKDFPQIPAALLMSHSPLLKEVKSADFHFTQDILMSERTWARSSAAKWWFCRYSIRTSFIHLPRQL